MRYSLFLLLFLFGTLFLNSCLNENYREDPDTFMEFSTDTLAFDTVFTSLGSATRSFKVYNPYNDAVIIDRIYLEGLAGDFFRLNIDGLQGNENKDIELAGKDSIYVFAEVTIDPNQPLDVSPFFVEDFVKVEVNGNTQSTLLTAWGQNANYIPNSKNKGGAALLSCDFGTITWDDPKPYVIYGVLLIDSCELVIPAGTDVFVHGGVVVTDDGAYNDGVVVVQENGILTVAGEIGNPVVFQGDRLEQEYADRPGQWGGIVINDLSTGSTIKNSTIKNSVVGIRVDSLASASLSKVQFYNQSNSGLVGYHASNIYAENCLFHSIGAAAVALTFGGNYELNYCTMSSYFSGGAALVATNYRCKEASCLEGYWFNPIDIKMSNCIIVGDEADEIILDDRTIEDGDFIYELDHCIVRVDELLDVDDFANFFDHCEGCYNLTNMDTLFQDPVELDFHLDTVSIAHDRGVHINSITDDIEGNSRDSGNPDPGCYEFN